MAKRLAQDGFYRGSAFFAQQCIEKALKGYLLYHKRPIFRIHDLSRLIELCCSIDETFKDFLKECEELKKDDVENRYPDDYEPIEEDEIRAALESAERVLLFVKNKIKKI